MNLLAATSALAPDPSPLLILFRRTLSRGSFDCHHVINVSLSQDVLVTNFAVRGAGRGKAGRGGGGVALGGTGDQEKLRLATERGTSG